MKHLLFILLIAISLTSCVDIGRCPCKVVGVENYGIKYYKLKLVTTDSQGFITYFYMTTSTPHQLGDIIE